MFCLVPGLGVGQRYFDPLAALLDGPVLRPDEREQLPVPELGRRLAAALPGPATLVANSFGCQVATEAALQRPELVSALVLIGPTVEPDAHSALRHVGRLLRDAPFEPPSLTLIAVAAYFRYGPLALVRQARHALEDRIEERLPLLDLPALVLRGERDPFCPAAWGARAAALLPQGRLVTLPGAHAVHYSHPREVAAEIRALREGMRAARG